MLRWRSSNLTFTLLAAWGGGPANQLPSMTYPFLVPIRVKHDTFIQKVKLWDNQYKIILLFCNCEKPKFNVLLLCWISQQYFMGHMITQSVLNRRLSSIICVAFWNLGLSWAWAWLGLAWVELSWAELSYWSFFHNWNFRCRLVGCWTLKHSHMWRARLSDLHFGSNSHFVTDQLLFLFCRQRAVPQPSNVLAKPLSIGRQTVFIAWHSITLSSSRSMQGGSIDAPEGRTMVWEVRRRVWEVHRRA